jgi:hypothetical protein
MLNIVKIKVTPELLANTEINDEHLFRELARKMVNEMPVTELNKLMKFTKTDPNSKKVKDKINDYKISEKERRRLKMLKREQLILYEAEVSL